jgi:aminomethyltransferase
MPEQAVDGLKRTPLYAAHVAAGARMVPFAGWEMPVQYPGGIIAEVKAVRTGAGMFDVSHMGRVEFSDQGAEGFLSSVLCVDMPSLGQGRSKYHFICNERGGIIDDAIVYRLGPQRFLLVINAGNADADMAWLLPRARARTGVDVAALTGQVAMIAVQGPEAVEVVNGLSGGKAAEIRRFGIGEAVVAGIPCRLARTGYTGEDGFEVMPPAARALEMWSALSGAGVAMCGLGARDVLRLEAGLPLHGNDLSADMNPYEAGLDRFVYLDGPGYVAADALRAVKAAGPSKLLVGLRMVAPGIPRHAMRLLAPDGSGQIGEVTSGTHSPTLDAAIGMGYVARRFAQAGTRISVDVRGKLVEAEVTALPFYSRKK